MRSPWAATELHLGIFWNCMFCDPFRDLLNQKLTWGPGMSIYFLSLLGVSEACQVEAVTDFLVFDSKITVDGDCSHEIKRHLLLGREPMTNLDSIRKSRDITLPTKVHIVKAVFSSSQERIWELDHKKDWAPKNWCFWTVVLEETLESLGQQGDPTSQS